ncbi:MAG TPA: hypothetical protein VHW43_03590 [Puia sp.]|nr:hypothetical protein [Puia sp.]
MLGSVSWMQFLSLLFLGLVVYYCYVAWRFGLLREWFGRREERRGMPAAVEASVVVGDSRGPADGGVRVEPALPAEVREEPRQVVVAQAASPPRSEKAIDNSALSTDKPASPYGVQLPLELEGEGNGGRDRSAGPTAEIDPAVFKQAEGVIRQVQDLVGEAAATQMGRKDFEDRISGLLAGHRQLWGTAGQLGIDNFLERSCRMQLRFSLTQEEIRGLWGVEG